MINFAYFKQTIKSNFKLWLVFTIALCAFMIVMCNVFTPQTMEGLSGGIEGTFAGALLSGNTLIGFMSNSFYAMMAIIFPMVYSIIVGNKLIASKVDDGSMAGYLSTPVSRTKIVVSSAIYFVLSLVMMWVVVSIVGIVAANAFQPDALDIDKFLTMNLGAFLYQFAISSICFVASCIFNSSKNSLLVGAGFPLFFFVISLLVKLDESLENLKYVTLNTLFDTGAIVNGDNFMTGFIILGCIGVVLYSIGIQVFRKKNLPL